MHTVAFDGQMGASGDMLLGALIAGGADPSALEPVERALDLEYRIDTRVTRGIESTDVTVEPSSTQHSRTVPQVRAIINELAIPEAARNNALAAYTLLAEAESAVHGTEIEETHFHEVGADDAIADIVGVALLLHELDPDEIVVGPLSTGSGEVRTSHGTYPIPPPAVTEILIRSELTVRSGPVDGELLTPTGAAILGAMATPLETLPPMGVDAVGYGVGDQEFPTRPNVIRALIGTQKGQLTREDITVLETNLDDATPELLGHLQDRLKEVGALDVTIVPTTMKKSRPGHLVKVVTSPSDAERVAAHLAQETGTLGVRAVPSTHRWVAGRRIEPVECEIDGTNVTVDVKIATDESGTIIDRSAEFDQAATLAAELGRPVREVIQAAEAAAKQLETD